MALVVDRLLVPAGEDPDVLGRLVALVNHSYAKAEAGLWLNGVERTNPDETRAAIQAERVLVAHVDGTLAGTVQAHAVDEHTFLFGTLAVDAAMSGRGVGSALVARVERDATAAGATSVRLEVLVVQPPHVHLRRLAHWYARMGYREISRVSLHEVSPREAAFPARPCEVSLMEKPLAGGR
jgi:N-acetylglutamate synthase-like GNAT family acetyltransferase